MTSDIKRTSYRGYRIDGDRCAAYSVEHYSGGDTILASDLASGRQLLWRAYREDTNESLLGASRALMSREAVERAIDRRIALDESEAAS